MRTKLPRQFPFSRFLLHWSFYAFLVFPATIFFGAVSLVVLNIVSSLTTMLLSWELQVPYSTVISGSVLGLVAGGVISKLQYTLIRQYRLWSADSWQAISMVGGAVGGVLVVLMIALPNALLTYRESAFLSLSPELLYFFLMPVFTLALSVAQWSILRAATAKAWVWVVANVVGGVAFSNLAFNNASSTSWMLENSLRFIEPIFFLLMLTMQGFITGCVLLWLFSHHAYPSVDPHAPEPPKNDRTASVWDEAI